MIKISFVMPCYNAQVYLAESVQSILNQTIKDIELIVVNDCSTDASRDILTHFEKKDKRVKVIDLKDNGGMSNARNTGNAVAKGKIIAVQDADDLSFPDRAKVILKTFAKNPKADLFYSAYTNIDTHGRPGYSFKAREFEIEDVYKNKVTYIGHPTMAYRKKVALKHPYQNGEWSRLGCEDFRLTTELWKTGHKFCFFKNPLVLYRWHDRGSTQTRDYSRVAVIKDEYIESYLKGADTNVKENIVS